jgi:diguanylate cyclase (GGDEF)-like protein
MKGDDKSPRTIRSPQGDLTARIAQCRTAVRSMQEGDFGWSMPAAPDDDVGKLGQELMRLARVLERRFQEANKIIDISDSISAGLLLDDVLDRVYESFRSVIPYNRIGCALLDDENAVLNAYWARSDASTIMIRQGYSAPMSGSSLQQILETGRPRILNDLEAYLADHPGSESTRAIVAEGMRSSLTCPLVAQGKAVGFLFFSSVHKDTYRDVHQGVFVRLAGQLSALIEKSRLYQNLLDVNRQLIEARQTLEAQAMRDGLTGILNRGAIMKELAVELSRARRHRKPIGVLMADIDHFKQINDNHRHLAGDAVLKAISERLQKCLRGYDRVGRYGGDEFLVVLGETDFDTAIRAAERLRTAVSSEPIAIGNTGLTVTASVGLAVADDSAQIKIEQLVSAADQALYAAKGAGRNRVEACRIQGIPEQDGNLG